MRKDNDDGEAERGHGYRYQVGKGRFYDSCRGNGLYIERELANMAMNAYRADNPDITQAWARATDMRKQTDLEPWLPGVLVPNAVTSTGLAWRKEALERELDQAMAGNRQAMSLDQLMALNAMLNTIEDVDHILGELTRGTA